MTEGGFTALMQASEYGRADLVRLLLEAGADPNRVNGEWTALKLAEKHQQKDAIGLLRGRRARA